MSRVKCEEMKILGNVPILGLCVLQLCLFSHSSDGPVVSCCHKTSQTMVARAKVKDYYMQKRGGLCSIEAMVFITVKEKRICSNPNSPWAKKPRTTSIERK
ncbi:hypothetical protein GJAV_G00083620 [Gymnothorax javanicus]|nr:hypothetical protein GJAV_G00083620 [Gymnothorax javanicus]